MHVKYVSPIGLSANTHDGALPGRRPGGSFPFFLYHHECPVLARLIDTQNHQMINSNIRKYSL
jgi:hypothetical protein